MFNKKMNYVVKTCSMNDPQDLQDLLNRMSNDGWELYNLQEDEDEEGNLLCHCIFMKQVENEKLSSDVINISSFKSRMEKMLSTEQSPYDVCLDIQTKIREQKTKISKAKKELEGEAPASIMRKKLNDKISAGLRELDDLKVKLSKATSTDSLFSKLKEEKLSIHLSEELLGYIDGETETIEEELVAETVKARLNLVDDLGYIIPKVIFSDDTYLNPYEFSIRIRGAEVFRSLVYPNYLMFFEDELNLEKKIKNSIHDIDKLSGKKVIWIERNKAKDFWCKGISGAEYIARTLSYCAVKFVGELLDYEDLEKYIDVVRENNEYLVDMLIPDYLSLSDAKTLLISLIREKVSIKDITYIFEKFSDFASDGEKEDLLDRVRISLSRQICKRYMNSDGVIQALELSDKTLMNLAPFICKNTLDEEDEEDDLSGILSVDVEVVDNVVKKIKSQVKKQNIINPILVVPVDFRTLIFAILNKSVDITVLAEEEVQNYAKVEYIGKI